MLHKRDIDDAIWHAVSFDVSQENTYNNFEDVRMKVDRELDRYMPFIEQVLIAQKIRIYKNNV